MGFRSLLNVISAVLVILWGANSERSELRAASPQPLDLSQAVIVTTGDNPVIANAAKMLQEEIEKRSCLKLTVTHQTCPQTKPAIVLGTVEAMPAGFEMPAEAKVPRAPEGYTIRVDRTSRKAPTVFLVGRDNRGALFAVGRLLREASIGRDKIELDGKRTITTAPRHPIRGHQLGFRNTANSYDAWDLATYEQYIRDCIIFGTNSIELISSLDPERMSGPVMQIPQRSMNVQLAELLHTYGLDVWLFLPLGGHIENPDEWRAELDARADLFAAYPAVDHVMVPGGDPGHTAPELLMPWLAEMATVLRKRFPHAGLWVSNQGFTHEQNDTFIRYLQEKQPDWLNGIVYGPWVKTSLREMRKRTPERYRIRRYPDITHCVRCQYPMPEWDRTFAQTEGREFTNPRPADMARIHNLFADDANGFVTYSDGCHDDLNKMIWTAMGWNPDTDVAEIVKEYGRVFFGDTYAEEIARGIWMLDSNWRAPGLQGDGIEATLAHWLKVEAQAGEALAENWRFQLYLLRAVCDAYLRARLIVETEQERRVYTALERARVDGVDNALNAASRTLHEDGPIRVRRDLRVRIEELALKLHTSIGMQYSVLEPYRASNTERGTVLDTINRPLNNRTWLIKQFEEIRAMNGRTERLARIDTLVHWESPHPNAFYDDLGCVGKQSHLVRQTDGTSDPGFVSGPQEEHSGGMDRESRTPNDARLSWLDQGQTLFGVPLKMQYDSLDPSATYRLRITYAGRYRATLRLVADERHEIHGPLPQPNPTWPVEFEVPREATEDGVLDLEWQLAEGRGCQVAEVWLIPE